MPSELRNGETPGPVALPQNRGKGTRKAQENGGGKAAADGTGMASKVSMDRFILAARKVQKDWTRMDKNGRGRQYTAAANVELEKTGAPGLAPSVRDIGSSDGQLDFTTWKLDVSERVMGADSITDEAAASVAQTVYHEARHGEQWFRMARLLAGKKKTAEAIQKEMLLPARVATEAVKAPLKGSSAEAREAAAWHKSVYGSGSKKRNTILRSLGPLRKKVLDARQAYESQLKAYRALARVPNVSPQALDAGWKQTKQAEADLRKAEAAWTKGYQAYRNLPEEVDAWKVGGQVAARYAGEDG